MASAPSLKELLKAIQDFTPNAHNPLPDELIDLIEAFRGKHEDKPDDSVSDKVHEGLLGIWHKDIEADPSRYTSFISLLRRFRPLIGQPAKVEQWFSLLLPTLEHLNQEKGLAAETTGIVLDILTAEDGNDDTTTAGGGANPLAQRLFSMWLHDLEVIGRIDDSLRIFQEKQFRFVLISYGKKFPKDFLSLLDSFFVQKLHRARILGLLSEFVKSQPPHLHAITETPLFANLITCLRQDTSTTIVSQALTVLTMVLPNFPGDLVPHLPALFNIYARLLFWERGLATDPDDDSGLERLVSSNNGSWEKTEFSPDFDDVAIPQLINYFTILYGLYPINFMDYLRKPQRYLRHAEALDVDDVEIQPSEIHVASARFRQCHLLHENFYTRTLESEKEDTNRWKDSETAEIVADCMALCQSPDYQPLNDMLENRALHKSNSHESEKDVPDSAILSRSFSFGPSSFSNLQTESWRQHGSSMLDSASSDKGQSRIVRQASQSSRHSNIDSMSTRLSAGGHESPTTSRPLATSGSQTHLQDMINSNKVIKSGLHQSLANDSVPSLSLSQHESNCGGLQPPSLNAATQGPDAASSGGDNNPGDQLGRLYRQILLLQNDLTFERFMKQQHLTHMGELRRRQVREAASEADMQNLRGRNKVLERRLEDAKRSELQVKKESENRRALAKKWEGDLETKLRTLREEQRAKAAEEKALRSELETMKTEAENLVNLVCEAEVRELALKQKMQSVSENADKMTKLEDEVKRLTGLEFRLQAMETESQAGLTRAAQAESRLELLDEKLQARQDETRQVRESYESQIADINAQLQEALNSKAAEPNPRAAEAAAAVDRLLSTSRDQQAELKKHILDLNKKNADLQTRLLEAQSEAATPSRSKSDPLPSKRAPNGGNGDGDGDGDADDSSPDTESMDENFKTRGGLSDPEPSFEATSYNATPPLEPFNPGTPSSTSYHHHQNQRPSTPAGASSEASSAPKNSPIAERYFGRGGFQNSSLKDFKDKKDKKDDKDKKERKFGSVRGIRGFG